MSALGLSHPHVAASVGRRRLQIGVAASLSFTALAALIFDSFFGSLSALLFLVSGCLLLATRPAASLQAILRFWYLLILPGFCLLSILWSQFPGLSFRYGLQFTITVVIAIAIATRISPTTFIRFLFSIYGIGIVGSILFGRIRDDIGAWIGIFGSKNAFAAVICAFTLASIAMLFDRTAPRLMRFAALAGIAAAGPLLISAQSTGAILFILPAAGLALAILLSRRLTHWQKLFLGGLVACLGLAGVILVLQYSDYLLQNLLDASGKDVTLTGRTELWHFAAQFIREHPWLGLGYRAFWVQGYPPAELLWAVFGINARAGFNFHNTYVNNAVEIGMIGVGLQILLLYGALARAYLWAFKAPAPETAFFASFLTYVVCSSFIEVAVFFQFSITSIIVICAFIYTVRAGAPVRKPESIPGGTMLGVSSRSR